MYKTIKQKLKAKTFLRQLKQNTNNVDAKITLKGKDGKTDQKVNLKLKDSVQNEFEVPITVENLSDGCEIDDAGVTLEELLAQSLITDYLSNVIYHFLSSMKPS